MVNKRFSLRNISLFGVVNTIILTCLAIITVYPVIYITAVSLSATSEVVQGNVTLFPKGFNLDAYAQVLNDDRVPRAYLNTIMYTALGTAINLLLTAVAAYPLARKNFFGRKFFLLAIIITMFLNPGIIPNYLIVSELGLLNSVWALVLPNAIWTFELLILKSFYENMSESLREAAVVDGASEYRILFQIVIPLSKPALASIGLFYFMGHWNSFFIPMIYLNDSVLYPLQVVLRDMLIFSENGSNPSLVDAAALAPQAMKNATIVLSMIPVLLIYPFAQKYFAKGVMLGSEKG
ncbi:MULTISPECIES: carbohydrate ABC transporter permease [Paenibacillus]|uniref:Binding-protein-dependent transport systems inner membrane component n=2 Tax=Paenibacillus lactis TaxID=228574 RepID=G4HHG9_9BACL|nr:carbohydrate ABC transporter permease [Paenibacillus lactis]EHB63545.1 binding-protein-dependent transport systems inner membrane component [Paenibacillus lactis 154]MBP1891826.1 putative aldouronate transport system permease protein [Paenibacillus lactis]MCM3494283.1 carbohydrate ABC transporter permease [Paenibacillus lactis]GIO89070.1 putative ABC transporter permease protein YtcP [Paenibacillus lactis]HAF99271.1 carbohydrate ABC transporter permease [Paenibacillus lactis]